MNGYFTPLGRKFGVLLLTAACVLMAGWMRSVDRHEGVSFRTGTKRTDSLLSYKTAIHWLVITNADQRSDMLLAIWTFDDAADQYLVLAMPDLKYRWKVLGLQPQEHHN